VILLGNQHVGKTAILKRFVAGDFSQNATVVR
jgi:GTPase SAR1 family protein